MNIYAKGWTDDPACSSYETDDYAGLYTFGLESFRYVRVRSDYSITIFDTPQHTSWQGLGDDGGEPGWQSFDAEIDGVGGMACDVKPTANAGADITGLTGQIIQFNATASQGNIRTYGWDLDGDKAIDLTGATPTWVFSAGFDRDVTLLVVDDRGCVGTDTVHVTIDLNLPKPDLTVTGVGTASLSTDLQTLQVSGSARVSIVNIGKAAALEPALVTVFEDTNRNGTYDADADHALGALTMPSGLARDGQVTLDVPLSGTVAFRDSPLYAMVDSDRRIEEASETNNVDSTKELCRIQPPAGDLRLKQKWRWSGSAAVPGANNVLGPVVVGQLTDDNADGRIDQNDVPDLVFPSYSPDTSRVALNAVSGSDGREIWSNGSANVTAYGSAALGDIDGDGVVEIVISNRNRTRLIAFEHDGTVKWTVPDGPTHADMARDGIAIADLDHDGSPEIIHGRRVYNADGTLRWEGTRDYGGEVNYGLLSVAADVDRDGMMEVVAGRTLYNVDGSVRWHRGDIAGDGFVAIGNFDDDDFAEIVLVASGKVYVLEHTGATKWGPVALPGGGNGGAPTVADFDGDGQPEIGVAGANNYVVFETNGAVKWTSKTQDFSSHRTGSSVFDFEADKRAEVLYADEINFYIYDGTTGQTRSKIPNGSVTTLEYPVVADVDNDGQAEVIVTANTGSVIGVRVFESDGADWPATRRIWNQHSYHITNINEDGSVPRHEEPSWLSHNTYRLNTFTDRDPLGIPDLTASRLRVIDNGSGQPASLSVRIGNAGAAPLPREVLIAFFEGDPDTGGRLLGTVPVSGLAPGQYQDVTLSGVTSLSGDADLYAVADYGNRIAECNEANNRVTLPVRVQSSAGDIVVATDAPVYSPNSAVQLRAAVTNTSAVPGEFRAELRIEDLQGTELARFAVREVGPLAGGAAVNLTEPWNSGLYLAGTYRLRGLLYSVTGTLLDEATSLFEIRHPQAATVSLRTTTDRPVYHTSDQALIENLVRNLTVSTLVPGARLQVVVRDPVGTVVYQQALAVGDLAAGAQRLVPTTFAFQAAAAGSYSVQGQVLDQAGAVLASATTQYQVREDLARALAGQVSVQRPSLYQGETQACTDTLRNTGTLGITAQPVRQALVAITDGQAVNTTDTPISLAAGATQTLVRSFSTAGLAVGDYACVLQAEIDGQWQTLGYAPFSLTEPPIRIRTELISSGHGRLLVLLDPDAASGASTTRTCSAITTLTLAVPFDPPLVDNASLMVEAFDSHGARVDSEAAALADFSGPVNASAGSAGGDLTLTAFTPARLTFALHAGAAATGTLGARYSFVVTLMENGTTLHLESGPIDTRCAEALTVGQPFGTHDIAGITALPMANEADPHGPKAAPALGAQRAFLEALLAREGWTYAIVTDKTAFARELRSGAYRLYALLSEQVKLDEQVQRGLREAVYRGEGLVVAGDHDQRNQALDPALGIRYLGKHADAAGVTFTPSPLLESGQVELAFADKALRVARAGASPAGRYLLGKAIADDTSALYHTFGAGRSVYAGFDLLAEAAAAGPDSRFATLLLRALEYVQPSEQALIVGAVLPVHLTLTNEGVATAGRAVIGLPPGSAVIDAGGAQPQPDGSLQWPFVLTEGEARELVLWLRLPATAGTVSVDAQIQVGHAPEYRDYHHVALELAVTAAPALSADVTAPLAALAAADQRYRQPLIFLQQAEQALAAHDPARALSALLRAADALGGIATTDAAALRQALGYVIRDVARQWLATAGSG